MRYGEVIGIGIKPRCYYWEPRRKHRKGVGSKQSLEPAVYNTTWSAFSSETGGKSKTAIVDQHHNHLDHVPVGRKLEEFSDKVSVQHSVVGCCEINKLSIRLLFILKTVLDILAYSSDLFYS